MKKISEFLAESEIKINEKLKLAETNTVIQISCSDAETTSKGTDKDDTAIADSDYIIKYNDEVIAKFVLNNVYAEVKSVSSIDKKGVAQFFADLAINLKTSGVSTLMKSY
jgi:hypothetical protein